MKVVRDGISRTVILIGALAFKVPTVSLGWRYFLQGLLANMQEASWWRLTRDPRLCPVQWSIPGGWLVVMRRARVLTESEWLALRDEHWRHDDLPVERKADSLGLLDGRLVAVDYGN